MNGGRTPPPVRFAVYTIAAPLQDGNEDGVRVIGSDVPIVKSVDGIVSAQTNVDVSQLSSTMNASIKDPPAVFHEAGVYVTEKTNSYAYKPTSLMSLLKTVSRFWSVERVTNEATGVSVFVKPVHVKPNESITGGERCEIS